MSLFVLPPSLAPAHPRLPRRPLREAALTDSTPPLTTRRVSCNARCSSLSSHILASTINLSLCDVEHPVEASCCSDRLLDDISINVGRGQPHRSSGSTGLRGQSATALPSPGVDSVPRSRPDFRIHRPARCPSRRGLPTRCDATSAQPCHVRFGRRGHARSPAGRPLRASPGDAAWTHYRRHSLNYFSGFPVS